jgi:hypothetical protein
MLSFCLLPAPLFLKLSYLSCSCSCSTLFEAFLFALSAPLNYWPFFFLLISSSTTCEGPTSECGILWTMVMVKYIHLIYSSLVLGSLNFKFFFYFIRTMCFQSCLIISRTSCEKTYSKLLPVSPNLDPNKSWILVENQSIN